MTILKAGVQYCFKSHVDRKSFMDADAENKHIDTALDNGFYVEHDFDSEGEIEFVDLVDSKGDTLEYYNGNTHSIACISKKEIKFFKEDGFPAEVVELEESQPIVTPERTPLQAFDEAVESLRAYCSERPFSDEIENVVGLLRFAITIQK